MDFQKKMKKSNGINKSDNVFLDKFRGKTNTTKQQLQSAIEKSDDYKDAENDEIVTATNRIYKKLQIVNSEYMKWFELLLACVFAVVGYMAPIWILVFQVKMRQLEMEDEVMQFQTIIMMLMRIERVNVEIILDWLERYSNIFKPVITKCVNNYEAGAWEALETMKDEVTYVPLIRIIESLQAAVEKIPIKDAFDELDSERDYYQAKRQESNERLIKKKRYDRKGNRFCTNGMFVCRIFNYTISIYRINKYVIIICNNDSWFSNINNNKLKC